MRRRRRQKTEHAAPPTNQERSYGALRLRRRLSFSEEQCFPWRLYQRSPLPAGLNGLDRHCVRPALCKQYPDVLSFLSHIKGGGGALAWGGDARWLSSAQLRLSNNSRRGHGRHVDKYRDILWDSTACDGELAPLQCPLPPFTIGRKYECQVISPSKTSRQFLPAVIINFWSAGLRPKWHPIPYFIEPLLYQGVLMSPRSLLQMSPERHKWQKMHASKPKFKMQTERKTRSWKTKIFISKKALRVLNRLRGAKTSHFRTFWRLFHRQGSKTLKADLPNSGISWVSRPWDWVR